jgi:group I intron endonuclease
LNTNFPTLIYGRVYAIKNMVNGKLYIGQTVKNLKNRLQCHFSGIGNSGAPKLVRAIKKYGKENFTISHLDSAQGTLEEHTVPQHFLGSEEAMLHEIRQVWGDSSFEKFRGEISSTNPFGIKEDAFLRPNG